MSCWIVSLLGVALEASPLFPVKHSFVRIGNVLAMSHEDVYANFHFAILNDCTEHMLDWELIPSLSKLNIASWQILCAMALHLMRC